MLLTLFWNDSEIVVEIVELWSHGTRNGVISPSTCEAFLVEDGLLWTDEGPLVHLLCAVREGGWKTDVEDLAVVVGVSVVSICLSSTRKRVYNVGPETSRVGWKAKWLFFKSFILGRLSGNPDAGTHGDGGKESNDKGYVEHGHDDVDL